mmetsp:Transcript_24953/g.70262  ORF Transcript_24953/g.70262 Transcript_24953/m.70262 type:complete len:216 (-) Transcript_24953:84-731(-)
MAERPREGAAQVGGCHPITGEDARFCHEPRDLLEEVLSVLYREVNEQALDDDAGRLVLREPLGHELLLPVRGLEVHAHGRVVAGRGGGLRGPQRLRLVLQDLREVELPEVDALGQPQAEDPGVHPRGEDQDLPDTPLHGSVHHRVEEHRARHERRVDRLRARPLVELVHGLQEGPPAFPREDARVLILEQPLLRLLRVLVEPLGAGVQGCLAHGY